MKRLLIATACVLLAGCADTTAPAKTSTSIDTAQVVRASDPLATPSSHWEYSEQEDKMTSKNIKYARVEANDLLELNFPYNGGSQPSLMIRNRRGEIDAILIISKGQFMTHVDGTPISVRFDSRSAKTWYCNESSDGDNRFLFIRDAGDFIARIKKAKKLIIEAELFDNGEQQMEFNVEGLDADSVFPHVAAKKRQPVPDDDPNNHHSHPAERVEVGVH